jgi:hypothetical protein
MGKAFDTLMDLSHKVPERLRKHLKTAKLFQYDLYPVDTMEGVSMDSVPKLIETFAMPFPRVAIEDNVGVVIFAGEKDEVTDLTATRTMIGLTEVLDSEKVYRDNDSDDMFLNSVLGNDRATRRAAIKDMNGSFLLYTGNISVVWLPDEEKWCVESADVFTFSIISANEECIPSIDLDFKTMAIKEDIYALAERDMARAAITAYEELLPLGNQDKVILRTIPRKKDKHPPKYPKTHQRPLYTLLKPNEARQVMGLPEPKPAKKGGRTIKERRAHWRREHQRVLRSPKWGDKVGTVIEIDKTFIPAFWNGDRDAADQEHYYKVILGDE